MLTSAQKAYVRRETLIGIAINAALSAAFVFLVFGGRDAVGTREIVLDALPQSFMIALMTTIVPTLLTRQRLRKGGLEILAADGGRLPANLPLRALVVAGTSALLGGALHWLVLPPVAPPVWSFEAVLAYKIAYGACLAWLLAPALLRRALADIG
jgi:hypothetical protein